MAIEEGVDDAVQIHHRRASGVSAKSEHANKCQSVGIVPLLCLSKLERCAEHST
jgi:hypothetical protein